LCDEVHEVEKITRIISSKIKDCVVEHEETVLRCPVNDEEWYYGKMLDDSLTSMRNAYRINKNLLTSDEIVSIRKRYKLSQKELSNLLGWGDITVSRYETKLIQDETYDGILRMVGRNPSLALEMLNSHKDRFNENRFIEIKAFLAEKIKADNNKELKRQEIINQYVDFDIETDSNGFKLLDVDKIGDILAYYANYVNKLYKVKLMKLLWYADVLYFKEYKKSMTGLVYTHMPLGALPIGHNEIVYAHTIKTIEEETENGTTYHILSLSPPVNPIFSLEEQNVLARVATKFKDYSANEIIKYMHDEEVYKSTVNGEIISYSKASSTISL